MDLKICTFNCCSLRKNINLVRKLTSDSFDIIFLQETFVLEDRLGDLEFIDENYDCVGLAATYSDRALTTNAGRAEGGLACLWKRNTHFKVNDVILEDKFIGLVLNIANKNILLVNVYIKSDQWEVGTHDAYLDYLSQLELLIMSHQFDGIYFLGDFNADPFIGRAWGNLCNFISRNYMECFDFKLLDSSSFTFVSYGNTHTKWLDHIIGRNTEGINISRTQILYDMIGSDHLPLTAVLHITNANINSSPVVDDNHGLSFYVDWNNLSLNDIATIEKEALEILNGHSSYEAINCFKLGCRNKKHLQKIDCLSDLIVLSVKTAAELVVKVKKRKNKFKIIPGWNRNVKNLHSIARNEFLNWVRSGKTQNSQEYCRMNESRKEFKLALNNCKINELTERSISIEENYRNKNMTLFWKEVKAASNRLKRSVIIDGKTDKDDIITLFTRKFLYNDGQDCDGGGDKERNLIERIRLGWSNKYKMNVKVSCYTLRKLIQRLKPGMGHDSIHSVFLKKASDRFLNYIAELLNTCFSHCYVPKEVLKGDINPTIKDTKNNCSESSNYRRVMQSSCILKILEIHLLDILEEKVYFNFRQFSYKKGTSTTDACFVLKETIHKYLKRKGKVFGAFIDLSKAFDKVDHFVLGNILMDRELPVDIVLLIMHYLRNQSARIVWGGEVGNYFDIDEGVRQGGIFITLPLQAICRLSD